MGALVDEEADRVPVDRHLKPHSLGEEQEEEEEVGDAEDEVGRRPRLDHGPHDAVVVAVDERLVQVQHHRLPPHHPCSPSPLSIPLSADAV